MDAAFTSPPETRARSRSKTPFTKGAEENGKDGRKSPDLQAITEDLETTASSTPIKPTKRTKAALSQSASVSSVTTTTTTVIQSSSASSSQSATVSTRKSAAAAASTSNGNNSSNTTDPAISTPPTAKKAAVSKEMKDLENKRTKEIKQNEVNEKIVKKTVTSTPKMSPNASGQNFKLNSSHEDLDLEKHPAYKQYLQAGEYWNKYPKTDYTYSETSVDRREIGQGYVSMPNMSRKSLDRHVERVHTMIQNNPEQASYLRQRYQINPPTNKSFKLFSRSLLNYDSGDEADLSQFDRRTTTRYQQESIVRRTVVRVWVWFTSLFTVFRTRTSVTREQFRAQYGSPPRVSLWGRVKTVSQRSWLWIAEQVVGVCKKIYVGLATVLYLDTLLVRQRRVTESAAAEKGAGDASTVTAADVELLLEDQEEMPPNKRRFLWLLIILLPILLLAGWYWLSPPLLFSSSSATAAWSSVAEFGSSSSSIIAEKYERSVEALQSLQMPPVAAYVSEAGSKAGEKLGLFGASALSAFSWLRWPSLNFTWNAGERILHVVNHYYPSGGSAGVANSKRIVEEKIVERVTVVHDWSKADLSGLREELRKELKIYVDGLVGEKEKQFEARRGLSNEEVDNLMNVLLDKLRAGDYFKLDLTQENFRAIFLEMRARFLDDNEVFVSRLISSVQGSLDLSSWEDKLEALKVQILGTSGDVTMLSGDVERLQGEMAKSSEDVKSLKEAMMAYINEMIKQRVTEVVQVHLVEVKRKEEAVLASSKSREGGEKPVTIVGSSSSMTNEDEVRRLITGALKVYDADKTGLADYALESSGGQVLSTRCTENYHTKSAQISVFGIPLWYPSNTPRTAIQPNVLPGNCWAFQGFPGFLVLQLNMDIYVDGFTMEHIPKTLSNGKIESAPKGFSVWGLDNENDHEPVKFGTYEYSDADDVSSYQHFEVQNGEISRRFRIVELRIESNHGHANYTCLYRFRVHGSPI